jgi:hypothetical protein
MGAGARPNPRPLSAVAQASPRPSRPPGMNGRKSSRGDREDRRGVVLGRDLGRSLQCESGHSWLNRRSACCPNCTRVHRRITLLSAMFMHGSWLHIIGNMLYLWIFGDQIEHLLGRGRFIVFYYSAGWPPAWRRSSTAQRAWSRASAPRARSLACWGPIWSSSREIACASSWAEGSPRCLPCLFSGSGLSCSSSPR